MGMEQVKIDAKGRLVIPERIRKELGVRKDSRLAVRTKHRSIIITKKVEPEEFIKTMEGFLKKNSPVQPSDPLKLKEIWAGH